MIKPHQTDQPTFTHGDLVAVGDIHGQIDLLQKFIDVVKFTGVHVLFLGDLVDRAKQSGDDVKVLNLVKTLIDFPATYGFASVEVLRGNHEQMLIDAIDGWDVGLWVSNGGDLKSLDELSEHDDWLRDLPLFKRIGNTLFVHAGVRPYTSLEDQDSEDLIWIREPFLSRGPVGVQGIDFVVHGHTPNAKGHPVIRKNRLCLDSAAFHSGVLTGYNHNTGDIFQIK